MYTHQRLLFKIVSCSAIPLMFLSVGFILSGCIPRGEKDSAYFSKLVLRFEVDRTQVPVGEIVRMRYTVKNTGEQPRVLESPDIPVLDIVVREVNSRRLVLSWSSQNAEKVLHRVEWQPGETKVLELQWIPDDQFRWGRLIHLTGTLSENSKIIQSVGVMICAGSACR